MQPETPMLRIYVVDDDPVFAETINEMLRSIGHQPMVFLSSQQAWEAISSAPPDLVMLDCGLEGISELELLDKLQRHRPVIPVIIVSARRWPLHHQIMHAYGARDVIEKPVTKERLQSAIEAMIAKTLQ